MIAKHVFRTCLFSLKYLFDRSSEEEEGKKKKNNSDAQWPN